MNRIRLTAAATCLVVLLAWTARADVLEQVPTDAMLVFKVNNLKNASEKFARFARDLGLAQMEPRLTDPLGFIQEQSKMVNGVNTAGDLAIAYLNPAAYGGDHEKSMVILIPVSDYQAFLANWPDARTEGNVTIVEMAEGSEDPGYFANWGSYAALSPIQQIVAEKPANLGIKFPAATAKELGSKDAVFVANFKVLGPQLQPGLRENRQKLLAGIEDGMANDPDSAKFAPVVKAIMNQVLNLADRFLSETDAAALGLNLTEEGIQASLLADFQGGSYLGQLMSEAKNNADQKLAGLPAGKYLFFGGSVSDPQATVKFLDDLAQPVLQEVIALGPEFQAAQDYYEGLKMYASASTGSSIGVLAPSGMLGADPLFQFVNLQSGDAQKMREGYKKMMMSQQELMRAVGVPADQVQMSYTANAKTIDGVAFDMLKSDFNLDPNDPSAGQAKQFMDLFYGPGGATVMLGVVDGKLMQAMGLKDEALSQAIAAAKGGLAPLADLPAVQSVSANLPKNNAAVFYVAVDQIVNTGLTYARQFGMPVQVQIPPDLPPIGGTISSEGPALRFDLYIPSQLVQSLVAAGMQAAMQMQGGGPGGGGL